MWPFKKKVIRHFIVVGKWTGDKFKMDDPDIEYFSGVQRERVEGGMMNWITFSPDKQEARVMTKKHEANTIARRANTLSRPYSKIGWTYNVEEVS